MYIGNAGLCGPPLPNNCRGDEGLELPPVIGEIEGPGIDELLKWFYIGAGTGFATAFWIVCGALFLNRRLRHAFFHIHDSVKDWVYVRIMLFIADIGTRAAVHIFNMISFAIAKGVGVR
nr:leucine-rich repeat domain, L domain-like protein [Tanacetum cinerariifolium]